MTTIKAPFNFVPLNEKVFFPDWAEQVSHDVPFKDGESGTIELKITAHSPIFVRNGHTKEDKKKNNANYLSSSHINHKYFIPATSIKGTIRNILEVISFGKMTQVENDSFSLRDLNNKSYMYKMKKVHCGWLYKEGEKTMLIDCGEPKKIPIREIDSKLNLGTLLSNFVSTPSNFARGQGRDAKLKYELLYTALTGYRKENRDFSDKFLASREYLVNGMFEGRSGTIVLTGQSSVRMFNKDKENPFTKKRGMMVGKGKEFLFPDTDNQPIEISESLFEAFRSIHKNTPDYKEFWSIKLFRGEQIPVFFQYNEGTNEIHSIGLSYLYKYPYVKSVYNGIPEELKNHQEKDLKMDLCETVFGHTYDSSLKGRVQFGHAMGVENIHPETTKTSIVLASPHASYYPLYLGKNENGQLQNWDNVSRLAGRKRYPIRNSILSHTGTDNVSSEICPLKANAIFKCKVRFHNLKPIEIGALLSALTFHDHKECFHNIGLGKPLGYGKVKLEASLETNLKGKESAFMQLFEEEMDRFTGTKWRSTPQFTELIAMAKGIPFQYESKFEYLQMTTNRSNNEFINAKREYNRGESYLQSFTSIINNEALLLPKQNKMPSSNQADKPPRKENQYYSRNKNIKDLEKEKGWELEFDTEYHAYIKEGQQINICPIDRDWKGKNIYCKYHIDDFSRNKHVKPGDVVKIQISEKEENSLIISITRIITKRY